MYKSGIELCETKQKFSNLQQCATLCFSSSSSLLQYSPFRVVLGSNRQFPLRLSGLIYLIKVLEFALSEGESVGRRLREKAEAEDRVTRSRVSGARRWVDERFKF